MTTARPLNSAFWILAVAILVACGGEGAADEECDPSDRFCEPTGGGRPRQDTGVPGRDTDPGACDTRTCAEVSAAGDVRIDTDNDGVADCIEGTGDPDGDTIPACLDDDSDDDGIPDADEGVTDTDGDGILDLVDTDSDGDNIPDLVEGYGDADEDGTPNYLDLDSDGDGWPDAAEYGREPGSGLPPINRDGDSDPDFLDLDSDGDGLADLNELGCPTSTDRTTPDTDRDGFHDLIEFAFGSDACDPESTIEGLVDFYFELPYMDPAQTDTLEFATDVRFGDVVFNMDTTGSMGGELDTLKRTLSGTILPSLEDRIDDVAIGVTRFDDFPCGDFGGGGDVPFQLLQRVTLDRAAAQSGVNALGLHNGGDYYESGLEALYQIATGAGRAECGSTPPFDLSFQLRAGLAEGTVGGVGFRTGAMPIVVQITDAPSHARNESGYPYGATRDEAYAALDAIGAKVIGVASGADARVDLVQMTERTGTRVPVCAWDDRRPGPCGAGLCCTGTNGAGQPPGGDGLCPPVFDINASNGGGLDTSIVSGIDALINYAPMDVTAVARRDPAEPIVDTACFIEGIAPDVALPRGGSCTTEPVRADFDGDGALDGFAGVTPGTQLRFAITARNDCVTPREEPQVFLAYIDVVGDGTTVLDTQLVTILVPPDLKR